MSEIPTTGRDKRIELTRGGHVLARPIPRSRLAAIAGAAGLKEGDIASGMRFQEFVCRCAIADAADLKDQDGKAVPFRQEKQAGLGLCAAQELYDALHERDVAPIFLCGMAALDGLSEEQRGN